MLKQLCLTLSMTLLIFSPAVGAISAQFKGRIAVEDGYYFVYPEGSRQKYSIVVAEPAVRSRLSCLKDGDLISGIGMRIDQSHISIRAIDYVGLKDLVALWRDENEIYKFADFGTVFVWDFHKTKSMFSGPSNFRYALSPYGESYDRCAWKIFLMDNASVILGSLEWSSEDQIHLQLYDTDTGEVTSSKHLIRGVL